MCEDFARNASEIKGKFWIYRTALVRNELVFHWIVAKSSAYLFHVAYIIVKSRAFIGALQVTSGSLIITNLA